LHHALVPASDDLPDADRELERAAALARAVELAAVGEAACGGAGVEGGREGGEAKKT
jgi:hypothetical protein